MQLLLASSSRYRRQLLERLGLPFSTASPDIDETPEAGETAAALVDRLALAKARALADQYREHLIIGSDQVAALGHAILGKPGTAARARQQLSRLSGKRVVFHTALVVLDSSSGRFLRTQDQTEVTFRDLSAMEIASYVDAEQPLDCAGAFKSEGLGVALFESMQTSDPSALIGLPLIELCGLLRAFNLNPLVIRAD